MNDSELAALIQRQIDDSINVASSESDGDSSTALDYYYGRPFGTEVEGQSKIVTRDVLETVEWILPPLLKPFVVGERTVVFDPTNGNDEDQAEQETDVINYIIRTHNNAYLFYYQWFKDALLQRNGYAKVWVEEVERTEVETYTGLTEAQFIEAVSQDNVEALEHTEYVQMIPMQTPMGLIEMPEKFHDVKIRITTKEKKFRLDVVPQEEMRISRRTRSIVLDESPFVAHARIMTVSELLEMDIDEATIKELPTYSGGTSQTNTSRRSSDEYDSASESVDESMREIQVYECYVRIDYDKDGKAELRKILLSGNQILENEETDFIPFEAITPIIMPHKHGGIGEADIVMDIQLIRSTLMRSILTNLYLTNNPEKEVVSDMMENMEDLFTSIPGGIKRVKQSNAIRELVVPFTAGASIPILDILDTMAEKRTGSSRTTQGMDADALSRSTKGAFMGALEQANQRVEMTARTFAETGVKGIFRKLHELVIKHQDKKMVAKLRDKWVEVSPTEWKHRYNMSVLVGIGTGNKDQTLMRLHALAEKQIELMAQGMPIVTPTNVYNTYSKIVEASDLKNVQMYFTDPATVPPKQQQPQENQLAEAEKVKGEYKLKSDQVNAELKAQLAQVQAESKREIELLKMQMTQLEADKDRQSREAIEAAKLEAQALFNRLQIDVGQPGFGAGLNAGQTNSF